MNKKLIALAIAGAMAAPLAAQADVTVYGKAHVSIDKQDQQGDNGDDSWKVRSRASRVGVKAAEDLGGGLKGIAQMEWQVDMADTNGAGNVTSRNQVVGLAGGFGTFVVGRHDTPFKMSTGKLDVFSDQVGDYNVEIVNTADLGVAGLGDFGIAAFDDRRANNAIAYISPNFNGLTIAAAIVPGENADAGEDEDNADGLTDGVSIAAMYSNGPLYVSLASETFQAELVDALIQDDDAATAPVDLNEDFTKTRLGVGYSIAGVDLGLVYETKEVGDAVDTNSTLLSAKYGMGANVLKAQYMMTDEINDDAEDTQLSMITIGVDHNFSKATTAYVAYSSQDWEAEDADETVLSLGMVHSF